LVSILVLLVTIEHQFVAETFHHKFFIVGQHASHFHYHCCDAHYLYFVHFFFQLINSFVALVRHVVLLVAVQVEVAAHLLVVLLHEVLVALHQGFEQVVRHVHDRAVLLRALRVRDLQLYPAGYYCVVARVSIHIAVGVARHLNVRVRFVQSVLLFHYVRHLHCCVCSQH
jgi:hypothetical protein